MQLYQPFFEAIESTIEKLKHVSEQHADVCTLIKQVLMLKYEVELNTKTQELVLQQAQTLLKQL